MTKQEAYLLVYKDLMQNPMFRGCYDAYNGAEPSYMHGIACVMESIAWRAGEDKLADEYNTCWCANMTASENVAELYRKADRQKKLRFAKMDEESNKFEKEYDDYEKTHFDN